MVALCPALSSGTRMEMQSRFGRFGIHNATWPASIGLCAFRSFDHPKSPSALVDHDSRAVRLQPSLPSPRTSDIARRRNAPRYIRQRSYTPLKIVKSWGCVDPTSEHARGFWFKRPQRERERERKTERVREHRPRRAFFNARTSAGGSVVLVLGCIVSAECTEVEEKGDG